MSRGTTLRLTLPAAVLLSGLALFAASSSTAAPAPRAKAHASVIGGVPANPAAWPFAAAIRDRDEPHCTGVVIAPTKVLTAAHCLDFVDPDDLTVVTGRPDLRDTTVGQVIAASAVSVHPSYGGNAPGYDFGVITLAEATTAPPAALASAGENAATTGAGSVLRVAGWGSTAPAKSRPSVILRAITQFAAPNKRCFKEYGKQGLAPFDPVSMICVKGQRFRKFRPAPHRKKIPGRTSACHGDSGGPLIADTPGGPLLVGTVSYGPYNCGTRAKPSVYGRVSSGLDYILGA